jgi:2'-phosphotransferase
MKDSNKKPKLHGGGGGGPTGRKLSHSLSWALRHEAPKLGFTMTPDGYVPVQEIIDCTHSKLKGATLEAIQQVVATNDKQRFKLQNNSRKAYYNHNDNIDVDDSDAADTTILCIRANQGHTIKTIDPHLLLRKISPEELAAIPCIVHGTYPEPYQQSIQTQGLKRMKRTHIHFASGLPDNNDHGGGVIISGMRKSCQIYIYVNAKKCAADNIEFFQSDNGVLLTAGVHNQGILPSKYFSHVTDSAGTTILLDQREIEDNLKTSS